MSTVRARRIVGLTAAAVSAVAIGAAASSMRASEVPLAVAVLMAMAWGAAPQAIDALLGTWTPPTPQDALPGSVTVVVHVGREPRQVSRASVMAAAASGSTIVVATEIERVEALGPIGVPVFVAGSVEEALTAAVACVETDAILLLSAGAFPDMRAVGVAAGSIRSGAGWVVGNAAAFNDDAYAPVVRDRLGGRLRASARRSGLTLWEPDATLISTHLLHDRPMEPGRPRGAWLRAWAAAGVHGAEQDVTFAVTGEPVVARAYWPASVRAQRGAVADVADAVISSRGRARWLAVGLLLRELYAYPLILWLLMPWLFALTDELPLRLSPWLLIVIVGGPGLLRWVAERWAHAIDLHPLEDALLIAYRAPGSALALPSGVTRRVRPVRVRLPRQPLAWAVGGFASISLVPLLSAGAPDARLAPVGLAIIEFGALWLLAMRLVFQRNWSRATYRVRVRLAARVAGRAAHTRDMSPTGVAVEGSFGDVVVGSKVPVEIVLDDESVLVAKGTIAGRWMRGDMDVLGIALRGPATKRPRWIGQLGRAAFATVPLSRRVEVRTSAPLRPPLHRRVFVRVGVGLVGLAALAAVATLSLALAGYRPLVVRSGSMEPALRVGDVVLVENVSAGRLAVGDIATFDDPDTGGTLTHRVAGVTHDGNAVTVATRGDANTTGESFATSADAVVGRVVWRLPRVGGWIAWAGSAAFRWIAGVAALAVVGLMWRRGVRDRVDLSIAELRRENAGGRDHRVGAGRVAEPSGVRRGR